MYDTEVYKTWFLITHPINHIIDVNIPILHVVIDNVTLKGTSIEYIK